MATTLKAFVFIFALLAPPAFAQEPASPVLVTVTGDIDNTNRGALDPFTDAFFNFQQKDFDKARGFTYAELAAMPQQLVNAQAEGWDAPVAATGPRLAEVMAAAGVAEAATVAFTAIDGYTVELDAEARKAHDWVLAIAVDGRPLALGGRGPAWLLYDTAGAAVPEDEEARWVWSVLLIEAKTP